MSEVDGSQLSPHGKSEDSGDDLEFLMSHYVDRLAAGEKLDPDASCRSTPSAARRSWNTSSGFSISAAK